MNTTEAQAPDQNKQKPLSRQRRWQIKQRENKKCVICGDPSVTAIHCERHAEMHRVCARERAQRNPKPPTVKTVKLAT